MHRLSSSFVLAYHGCQRSVGEKLLDGIPFEPSNNGYDWLGSGIYFWESNPRRALEWAQLLQERKGLEVSDPFVVGAAIDLGFCLDLLTSNGLFAVKAAHAAFELLALKSGSVVPGNSGGSDLLLRRLDYAVINHLHSIQSETGSGFDSVRGVFIEGERLYENSGFREKTHLQICVRNPAAIKGVFRVPPAELK